MEIGNKIKEARNGAELTQDQAAEKIMVSRQTISNWETGDGYCDIMVQVANYFIIIVTT